MSNIDLGIRVLLNDMSGGGFSSLGNNLRGISAVAQLVNGSFGGTASKISALEGAIASSESKLHGYSSAWWELHGKIAASQVALDEVKLTTGSDYLGAERVQLAQMEVDRYTEKVDTATLALERMKLSGSGFNNKDITAQTALITDYQYQLDKATLKMQELNNQGLAKQEAAVLEATAAIDAYNAKLTELELKEQATKDQIAAANLEMETQQTEAKNAALGIGALIGSGIAMLGFGVAIYQTAKQAANLEDTMNNVSIAVKGASSNMQAITDSLNTLADTSIFSSTDIGDAFVQLGERGYNATDIINHLGKASTDFAEATSNGVVPAAILLSGTMQAYGASADQASQYADALTYATLNGIPKMSDLTTALQGSEAEAVKLGIPIQDLVATLTLLSRAQVAAGTAGTGLTYMLKTLTEPVPKAEKELSDLGILLINSTTPAFVDFKNKLDATAHAAKVAPVAFNGTLTSLNAMYTQAQKIGAIATDKTFIQWAAGAGILKDKLYDVHGNFIGISAAIKLLEDQIAKLPKAEQPIAEGNLFNQRSSKVTGVLIKPPPPPMQKHSGKTGAEEDQSTSANTIANASRAASISGQAAKDAEAKMNSFNNKMKELGTTFQTFEATIGTPLLGPLKSLADTVNGLLGKFITGDPTVRRMGAAFLVAGFATAFLIFGIVGITMAVGVLGTTMAPIILGVALAVIGLSVAGALIGTHWASIVGVFNSVKDAIVGFVLSGSPVLVAIKGILLGVAGAILYIVVPALATMTAKATTSFVQMAAKSVWGFGVWIVQATMAGAATLLPFLPIIAIGALIGLVVAGVVLLFMHWGTIGPMVAKFFSAIGANLAGFGNNVKNLFVGMWTSIVGVFTEKPLQIIKFIQGWIQKIINHFLQFADHLVGHSIIPDMWKMIVEVFVTFPAKIIALVVGFITSCISFFTHLISNALAIFNGLGPGVQIAIMVLITILGGGLIVLGYLVITHWSQITGFITSAWSNIRSAVSSGVSNVISLVTTVPGRVMSALSGLGGMLLSAGENMMNMLGQGILNGLSALRNAVGNVASTIKGWLGFKSPTKEGPLSDSDQYMPNMMKMYATGIKSNAHLVHSAIGDVAGGMKPNWHNVTGVGPSASQSGQGAIVHNHFYIDTKEVATAVQDQFGHDLKMNNMSKAFR